MVFVQFIITENIFDHEAFVGKHIREITQRELLYLFGKRFTDLIFRLFNMDPLEEMFLIKPPVNIKQNTVRSYL